eukprot:108035-Amphidinium_carterae.1
MLSSFMCIVGEFEKPCALPANGRLSTCLDDFEQIVIADLRQEILPQQTKRHRKYSHTLAFTVSWTAFRSTCGACFGCFGGIGAFCRGGQHHNTSSGVGCARLECRAAECPRSGTDSPSCTVLSRPF